MGSLSEQLVWGIPSKSITSDKLKDDIRIEGTFHPPSSTVSEGELGGFRYNPDNDEFEGYLTGGWDSISPYDLPNVDNTSDADKPISTATQAALDSKYDKSGGVLSGPVHISTADPYVVLQETDISNNNVNIRVTGGTLYFQNRNDNGTVASVAFSCDLDGSTVLKYNGSDRVATSADGINVTGKVSANSFEGQMVILGGSSGFSNLDDVPDNIATLTGTEVINNSQITINTDGTLSGAGAGQVTAAGLGAVTQAYLDANYALQTTVESNLSDAQLLLDGQVGTWFYNVNPTLANAPASTWTDEATKDAHVGDLYFNKANETSYRFAKLEEGVYEWKVLGEGGVAAALLAASTAQDTADNKRRVFVITPTAPYDIGDLWIDGDLVKRSTANRVSGYSAGEWVSIANYTTKTSELTDDRNLGGTAIWGDVGGKPSNLSSLTGTEIINNSLITINTDGTLSGAGTGQVTAAGLGAVTQAYLDANYALQTTVESGLSDAQLLLDGQVETWFYNVDPTLANAPASTWADNTARDAHVGDLYFNKANETSYRFAKLDETTYSWKLLGEGGVAAALLAASTAQDTADNKRRVFVTTPDAPYDTGDLWVEGALVKRATADRVSGYSAGEWVNIANYTTNTSELTDDDNLGGTANWGDVDGKPGNLTTLTGTEVINNSLISISSSGVLNGGGGGAVTAAGLGVVTDSYAAATFALQTTLTQEISDLQSQIDGNITSWFYDGLPTTSNAPASTWTTNTERDNHLGDLYYDGNTQYAYRYRKVGATYSWERLLDTDITLALGNAQDAQDTADNKRRVFVVTPTVPYDIGDLWTSGDTVKRSTVNRTDTYNAGDWIDIATIGAPAGTLVNGVDVADITNAVQDFNSSNNRNNAAISSPTVATNGTAIDHTTQDNGTSNVSFEWGWTGNEADIDGFIVYVRASTSATAYTFGTTEAQEVAYNLPASKKSIILYGLPPTEYYTFGVKAYRKVDSDVTGATDGLITSTLVKATGAGENPYRPESSIAFAGDITGSVGGIPVAQVNDWDFIQTNKPDFLKPVGAGTGLFMTDNFFGYFDSGVPKSYIGSDGDFYFGSDGADNYIGWDGTTLVVRGDVNATSITTSIAHIGLDAGLTNQGASALAIGDYSGTTNQGASSVSVGFEAGNSSQGINSIAIGTTTAKTSQGAQSIAVGYEAARLNQGTYSIAIGVWAGEDTQGINSLAIGSFAGRYNQDALGVAVGLRAGETDQSYQSTAIGSTAGRYRQGESSTAIGTASAYQDQGYNSVAIGVDAGHTSQGDESVAIGRSAGNDSQGSRSVAIGKSAGEAAQGTQSVAIGYNAGEHQGNQCIAIGLNAGSGGPGVVQGNNSVAIGLAAGTGTAVSQGTNSTCIGGSSRGFANGATCIGHGASITNSSWIDSTCLGIGSQVTGSNQVQLGASSTTTYAYGAVQDRSDIRDKAFIEDTNLGLDFINGLRPVEFRWDYRESYIEDIDTQDISNVVKDGSKVRSRKHQGFIAQEVKELIDSTGIDFGGYQDHSINGGQDVRSLGYSEFIAPIVKAMQELSAEVETLKARIDILEG